MFLCIIVCFHFCWFWNIFFDTLQLVSGYFCAILVRNFVRVVVSCDVSMKIYQNSTKTEANDLRIYKNQKTSGNLENSSKHSWTALWRHVMWTLRANFVSILTMHLNHLMDRCTLQDNCIQEFFSSFFCWKLQYFFGFKMCKISNFFAID